MDEIIPGLLIAAVVVAVAVGSLVTGHNAKEASIVSACADFHQFRINDKVYVCEEKKP